ncbi:MAG: hypothetical protein WD934_07925, partial [Gemmatimonadales bacterium]
MRGKMFALLLVVACGDATTDPNGNGNGNNPLPTTASVTVADNSFTPGRVDLAVHGTVTWTWAGFTQHTLTFDDADIASAGARTTGNTSRLFSAAGEYTYFCEIHGRGMSGRVV